MSDIFPYVNTKLSRHLLLNLLRWVPLHPEDPITTQTRVHPCWAAGSSLRSADTDLGTITSPELLWLSSPTWSLVTLSNLGPHWETEIYCRKTIHPFSFSTVICFFTGKACPAQSSKLSLLAWLDMALPLHESIFVSNAWIVAVWIHTTGTSLWHFLISSDLTESSLLRSKIGPLKLLPESLSSLSFFFRMSSSRCLVSHPLISTCHLLWRNREDTSILSLVMISDFFSIIVGFRSMQVHSKRQYFLTDAGFLSSVMHFLIKFDSSFCRDSGTGYEVVRFPLSFPLPPYVWAFFFPFFIIFSTMYILDLDCCAHVLCWYLFALLSGLLFLSGLN